MLYPREYIIEEIAQKYGVPFEIVESILVDWALVNYVNLRDSLSRKYTKYNISDTDLFNE
jgi:hypothetical protein